MASVLPCDARRHGDAEMRDRLAGSSPPSAGCGPRVLDAIEVERDRQMDEQARREDRPALRPASAARSRSADP